MTTGLLLHGTDTFGTAVYKKSQFFTTKCGEKSTNGDPGQVRNGRIRFLNSMNRKKD
jgi:hypothetical protein